MSRAAKKHCALKSLQQLQPFYTGGSIRLCCDEQTLVAACGEEAKVVDMVTGDVLKTLPGDTEPVTAIAVHPSGTRAVVASRSYITKLWDIELGRCLRTWQPHRAPVIDAAFDASGGLVATASAAKEVRVWDVDSGSCTHCFTTHSGIASCVLFHSRQRILVTAGADGTVIVCDLQKKNVASKLKGHVSAVTAIAWAANETCLLSAGRDKVVNIWDVKTFTKARTVAVLESVEALVVLPKPWAQEFVGVTGADASTEDRVVFATGGESGVLKCWDANSSRCLYQQERSSAMPSIHSIVNLHVLSSSQEMLAVSADCALTLRRLRESDAGEEKILLGNLGEVTAVSFEAHSTQTSAPPHVAVATNSDVLYVFDTKSLTCSRSLQGHTDTILSLTSAQTDGSESAWLLASGSKDNSVRLWHPATGRCVAVGNAHMGSVTGVTFCLKKQTPALVSCGADKLIQVWDIADVWNSVCSGDLPTKPVLLSVSAAVAAHDKEIHCVAVSPTGSVVASGSADRSAKVWTLPALSAPLVLAGHKRGIWDIQFSPIEQAVLTCSGDATIKFWSVKYGTCLRTFSGHSASVLKIRFISNGHTVLSASSDGLVKSWSTHSGQCLNTEAAHDGRVWALEVAGEDNGYVVSGSDTGSLIMWAVSSAGAVAEEQAETEELIKQRQELRNAVQSKQHLKAAKLAVKLRQPRQLLELVKAVMRDSQQPHLTYKTYIAQLAPLVQSLSHSDIQSIFTYMRDWNTSPKNCACAQALLGAILATYTPKDIASIQGLQETSEALLLYTGRHYDRMDRMLESTYLLDYLLSRIQLYKLPAGATQN